MSVWSFRLEKVVTRKVRPLGDQLVVSLDGEPYTAAYDVMEKHEGRSARVKVTSEGEAFLQHGRRWVRMDRSEYSFP